MSCGLGWGWGLGIEQVLGSMMGWPSTKVVLWYAAVRFCFFFSPLTNLTCQGWGNS
jgi:hypothetical protein